MKRRASFLILFLLLITVRLAGQTCTPEAGSGDMNQTVCAGIAIVDIKLSLTGATSVSSITYPAGLSYSFTAPVITVTGTPTVTGAISITLSDGGSTCTSSGTITVTPQPTANAGTDLEICQGGTTAGLGGSVGGSATGGTWTTPDGGTFSDPNDLNSTWTPGAAFTGTATLTLTTTGSTCGNVTDTKQVTVYSTPTADAGLDLAICQGETTTGLGGSVGGSATGGTWSTPAGGTFSDPNDLNATWTPGAAFTGTATLTLTTTNPGSCSPVTDTRDVVVTASATANAGTDLEICQGGTTAGLGGSVGGSATGGTWTTPDGGTFSDPNDLNSTWTPGAAFTGTATLTLTTTGSTCGNVTDTKQVTVYPTPTADAGLDLAICQGETTTGLGGSVGGSATGGTWSTPAGGTFSDPNDLNATWTPGAAFTGTATLTLTTTNPGSCSPVTDTRDVVVTASATANAGTDLEICQGGTTAGLGGSVGGSATGGTWTTPDGGTFSDPNDLNSTWTPGAAFTGTATLTLTTSGGSCGTATDTKSVLVNAPTAEAGSDMAICIGGTTAGLGGSVGGSATGGTWTTPAGGTFSNPNDLNATWTPGAAFTGTATLTLTTSGGSCGTTTDTKSVTVNPKPVPTGVNIHLDAGELLKQYVTVDAAYTYTSATCPAEVLSGTRISWYRANNDAGAGEVFITTKSGSDKTYVLSGNDVGKYIQVRVEAWDGTTLSAPFPSLWTGPVQANDVPVASNLSITGTPSVGEELTAHFDYSDSESDPAGTPLYKWYADGAVINKATSSTYTIVRGDRGKVITFSVQPVATSGSTPGVIVYSPATPTVADQAPVAANVSFTGILRVGKILTGTYQYSDNEGDLEGASVYQWYSGASSGALTAIPGATSISYILTNNEFTSATNYIAFSVKPVAEAGTLEGITVTSTRKGPVTNPAPSASFPGSPVTGTLNVNELLTGHYIYSDGEGDLEGSSSISWDSSPNGTSSWISAGSGISHLVTESEQGRYFRIRVTPRAATGTAVGIEVTSLAYGPVNTKPHIDGIGITGTAAVGTALTGTYSYHDIDGDPVDHVAFSWMRDGTTIPGQITNTYTLTYDDEGHVVTFRAIPYAQTGYLIGDPASINTASVTDSDPELPTATNICIEGARAVGEVLKGKYSYVHHRPELNSEYKWFRNDVAIAGAIAREYTVQAADTDAKITFKVRPRSSNVPQRGDTWFESQEFPRITGLEEQYGPNATDVTLSITPALDPLEGYYTGKGVTGTTFSPVNAGVGIWEINYFRTYTNGSNTCSQRAPQSVKISAELHSLPMNSQYCSYDPVFTVTVTPTDFTPNTSSVACFDVNGNSDMAGISRSGYYDIIINPANLRDGKHSLYYSYTIMIYIPGFPIGRYINLYYKIKQDFTIVKVSKETQFIGLRDKYCKESDEQIITVAGVNSLVGTATWQFEGDPSDGAILTETATGSSKLVPGNAVAGRKYIKYKYTYSGCESNQLRVPVDIYNSPDARFDIDNYYNIDGPDVALTPTDPANTGGIFAGEGVSGNLLIPSLADEGPADITYTFTDVNMCVGTWTEHTTYRKAIGTITGITDVVCYQDINLTLNASGVPVNGVDGVVSYKGFSNQRGTLTAVPGTTSAIYSLPAIGEGEDIITFSYIWDGVDFSVSKKITLDNLGTVNIYNLAQNQDICDDAVPFLLTVSKPGGVFTGRVSGNNFDPKANTDNWVKYTYTNSKTGCSISTTVDVNVYQAPVVDFIPSDLCINDENDTLRFINKTTSVDPVVEWKWEFTDESSTTNSSLENAGYLYLKGGLQTASLSARTDKGCVVTKEKTFTLARKPEADFYWKKDCFHDVAGESLLLFDATKYTTVPKDYIWIKDGEALQKTGLTASYDKSTVGYLRIKHVVTTNTAGCQDTVVKDVYIRPTFIIPPDGKFEDFESGNGGWVKSDTSSIWSFGMPSGSVLKAAASGSNAWFTALTRNDTASVESPCYDFSNLTRPLIKVKLQKALDKERDGVVMQYRVGDEWRWHTVGTLNDGINWYNSATISGEPGGSQVGWTTPGTYDTQFQAASHTLDELIGRKDVIFRMTYGSDGSKVEHDGFIFDDVFIGDRTRHVLIEHFMNLADSKSSEVKSLVDTISEHKKVDVINIQYHTNFPGNDQYFAGNPGEINARILYYGLTRVPFTFIDGGNDPKMHALVFDHYNTEIDSNAITKRSLVGSPFTISLDPLIDGRLLSVRGTIKAVEKVDSANLTLFMAVTEKKNTDGGASYLNIFRKFIPDAGGIILKNNWVPGDVENINQTWTVDKSLDASSIEIIAFLQNRLTQQVYQSFSVIKPKIAVGIDDRLLKNHNYTIYPNPASDRITINFGSQLTGNAVIRIFGIGGEVLREYKAGAGTTEFTIEDPGLNGGIYMLRVTQGKNDFGYRKLIIAEN